MTIHSYMVCPVCGRNRVIQSKKGTIRWDYVDLDISEILQKREQHARTKGGQCLGFTKIPNSSLTLAGMMADPQYAQVLADLKAQIIDIVKTGKKLGWIQPKEV